MTHYSSHPTHTHTVCGDLLRGPATEALLDPSKTTCPSCLATLAWRLDSEGQYVLRALEAGASDAQAIAESARVMLAAAITILERLQRCHQIIQDQRGRYSRTKVGL